MDMGFFLMPHASESTTENHQSAMPLIQPDNNSKALYKTDAARFGFSGVLRRAFILAMSDLIKGRLIIKMVNTLIVAVIGLSHIKDIESS